jgi:heptosyltransferase-2
LGYSAKKQNNNPRIAVLQTAFSGDVVLVTPIFEALRDLYKNCHISAIVRPESVCLLKNNPNIDAIVSFDKYGSDRGFWGLWRIAGKIRAFDMAFVIQRHFRTALIPFLAGVKKRVGYDIGFRLFYTKSIKYQSDTHEVLRCLQLAGIEAKMLKYRPKIYLDDATLFGAEKRLHENNIQDRYVVIAPGSIWPTKRYSQYDTVINSINERLKMPVILVGSADDRLIAKGISDRCRHVTIDLTGKTTLIESAALISKASLVISNDSAPAHIAAAFDTPVVMIMGPTVSSFGFTPYSDKSKVVDIGNLYCRPCSSHGSKKCPEGHFRCMKELNPAKILEAAESLFR